MRDHYGQYVQVILAGKVQIPLIMGGAAENRARAIFNQDKVRSEKYQVNRIYIDIS